MSVGNWAAHKPSEGEATKEEEEEEEEEEIIGASSKLVAKDEGLSMSMSQAAKSTKPGASLWLESPDS